MQIDNHPAMVELRRLLAELHEASAALVTAYRHKAALYGLTDEMMSERSKISDKSELEEWEIKYRTTRRLADNTHIKVKSLVERRTRARDALAAFSVDPEQALNALSDSSIAEVRTVDETPSSADPKDFRYAGEGWRS